MGIEFNIRGRGESGFTLIEILVVVVILGILAAMVVPKIMDRPEQAKQIKARQDIRAIEAALDLYKLDNFIYPTTDQGLQALVEPPGEDAPRWKEGGYLKDAPVDPWRQPYQYMSPGTHGSVDVFSLGPDGQPSDDDIGNWNLQG